MIPSAWNVTVLSQPCLFFSTIFYKALLHLQSSDTQVNSPLRSLGTLSILIVHIYISFSLSITIQTNRSINTHNEIWTPWKHPCILPYSQNLIPKVLFQYIFPLFMVANLACHLGTLPRRGMASTFQWISIWVCLCEHFVDCWLIQESPASCGQCHPEAGVPGLCKDGRWASQVKQASNPSSSLVSASVTMSKFLPWVLGLASFNGGL